MSIPAHRPSVARTALAAAATLVLAAGPATAQSTGSLAEVTGSLPASGSLSGALGSLAPSDLRVATYNLSLNRGKAGQLVDDLSTPDNAQASAVAAVIQANDPDIVLVNEFDYYADNRAADLFRKNYLEVSQHGQEPVSYPYAYTAPVNTGVPTGRDLNHDGRTDGPDDAYGFGLFPGQYGMLVLSKHPIDTAHVRTFQNFLWKDMPDNLLPRDYYGADADALRLSSKSHWDVPVLVDGKRLHVLASHPTPPSFDGPEDRNGRRNHDEIRLWADYMTGGEKAAYLYDDEGVRGGLPAGERFVMLGDQNSDPADGDSWPGAIEQVLAHPRVTATTPTSEGAAAAAAAQPGNETHRTPAEQDTADFTEPKPGNLRVDYVLPSTGITVRDAKVYWQAPGQPLAELMPYDVTSDHRLVWADLTL